MKDEQWNGKCPKCGSDDVELVSDNPVSWGNDDQGEVCEEWACNACRKRFETDARVEVTSRRLTE